MHFKYTLLFKFLENKKIVQFHSNNNKFILTEFAWNGKEFQKR